MSSSESNSKTSIWVAVIGAIAVMVSAWLSSSYKKTPTDNLKSTVEHTIKGSCVDINTNKNLPQVNFSIVGRNETAFTDDNGNFVISLQDTTVRTIRIHATKDGYRPTDRSLNVPSEDLVIPMTPIM